MGSNPIAIRGLFSVVGRTFSVSDGNFDEILSNGSHTFWGTVTNDGLPVSMASSPQQLLIASGGTAYVFNLTTNTLAAIPGATFSGPVAQCGICDDFFIVTIADSKTFYVSGVLNANDWTTNGASLVSVFPDNIVSMIVDHREIWFFSDTQSVVYYDSGNVFPFDVIPGAFIETGCAAEFSPVQIDNTVAWLGQDARGAGVVWRAYGYTPQRISNHALEFALQGYATVNDAIGFSYQDQGHFFYVLYFPNASKTWCYDTITSEWHERGFWLETIGQYQAAHFQNHTYNFGMHLVGDWNSDNVYEMHIPVYSGGVWTFATDNGNPIRRVRRSPHLSKEQKWNFFSQLIVYLESGIGPIPPFQAIAGQTTIVLQDSSLVLWNVTINDSGTFVTASGATGAAQLIYLQDTVTTNVYQLTISTGGIVGVTLVSPVPASVIPVASYPMITITGDKQYNLQTFSGTLTPSPSGGLILARGPILSMRMSKDGGHTYSNSTDVDCGQAGNYQTRVRYSRLGRARDAIFEISTADAWAPRIIDGYLEVEQGDY